MEYPKELKFKVNNIFGPEDIANSKCTCSNEKLNRIPDDIFDQTVFGVIAQL